LNRIAVRASLLSLALIATAPLQGCLMIGNSPSGTDMRLLYAAVIAFALAVVLWIVIRFMK
jgi:hypothetical protein